MYKKARNGKLETNITQPSGAILTGDVCLPFILHFGTARTIVLLRSHQCTAYSTFFAIFFLHTTHLRLRHYCQLYYVC